MPIKVMFILAPREVPFDPRALQQKNPPPSEYPFPIVLNNKLIKNASYSEKK